jgi:hypothetical protein
MVVPDRDGSVGTTGGAGTFCAKLAAHDSPKKVAFARYRFMSISFPLPDFPVKKTLSHLTWLLQGKSF